MNEHAAQVQTPRRVLMVAPHPCFEARGTPMNVQLMCRVLVDLGFEVHLATYPMGPTVPISGLIYHRVMRLPGLTRIPIGFSLGKIFYDVLLAGKVARLLLTKRFDAVHAVEESAFFSVPLARLFRTPAIADLDSDLCDQLRSHRWLLVRLLALPARWMQWLTLKWSACTLTVCQSLTDHVGRVCPGEQVFQIEDVPLPAVGRPSDPAEVAKLRQELGIEGRRVILYTGNLEPYQGVDLLVGALPTVIREHVDAVLVVVGGEDDQIAALRELGESLSVSSALHVVGKRDPETMPEFMGVAEVLASPRCEGENTPLKIYTYMLSGRPIVATNLPTHTQVLDEQTAILTPATPAGLGAGLIRALNETTQAALLAERAREKVQREHSYEGFKRKLEEVYSFVTR